MVDYIEKVNDNSLDSEAFDGQRTSQINNDSTIFSGQKFTADQWKTYSLGSLLPNDGYDYEVQFEVWTNTGSTSGNATGVILYSGTATSSNNGNSFAARVTRTVTRASSTQIGCGAAILPIKASDRNVTYRNADASGTSGNHSFYIRSKKRIGSNLLSTSTKYVSNISNGTTRAIGGSLLNGKWVYKRITVARGLTLGAGASSSPYSLSSYLPNDGYDYEVLLVASGSTGASSGNNIALRPGISSSADSNTGIGRQVTRTSSSMITGGQIKVVIGTARTVYIGNGGSSGSATGVSLYAMAYRRIGTSNSMKTTSICIPSQESTPNAIVYGTPTITNGVISNFSQNNYLRTTDNKSVNNAEYVYKFTTGSTTSATAQTIAHCEYLFALHVSANTFEINTYNWETATSFTLFTALPSTTYWVKILINGTTKTFSYSIDGENYTELISFSDSLTDVSETYPITIGNSSLNKSLTIFFLGTIDLNGCYTNINGVRAWNGMDFKKYLPVGGYIADGQWVKSWITAIAAQTFAPGSHTFNVSNYLPENNVQYEVLGCAYGRTGTTSGNNCTLWISKNDQVFGEPIISYVRTRSSSNTCDERFFTLICTQVDGKIPIIVYNSNSSQTTGSCAVYFTGYRRIGDNT